MDIIKYKKAAWNHYVDKKDKWTIPVSEQELEQDPATATGFDDLDNKLQSYYTFGLSYKF